MRVRIISLALSLVVCAAGCSRQAATENPSQTTQQADAASSSATAAAGSAQVSQSQASRASAKVYRGSLGDRGLEMRLAREGEHVSGSYQYDGIGEELKLDGRAAGGDKFELAERDAAGRQTGKWSCGAETRGEWGEAFTCKWTKPDGRGEMFVALYEQASDTSGWRVVPKVVEKRKAGVRASYPQIVADGGARLSVAAEHFNRLLEERVGKEARAFAEELDQSSNNYFHADYNVLAATGDLLSVEISYDSYAGGAHPNSSYEAVTYDLRADREIKLEELFKPGSSYAKAISAYCEADIRRRTSEMEAENARQEHRAPAPEEESPVSRDSLEEISAFAITPKGLMIYYDLPHVIAALDRNFVPYSAIRDKLKPDSPAARFAQ